MTTKILVILGATASGKTRLAVQLANQLHGEILSADSRQVYQGLDIGTGKDLKEYGCIPYHLIDVVKLGEPFHLFEFQQRFYKLAPQIQQRDRLPILVGGTGLYLESVIKNYQLNPAPPDPTLQQLSNQELQDQLLLVKPAQHNTTDTSDRERMIRAIEIARTNIPPLHPPPCTFLILGMRWERAILRQRIAQRLTERLENGLIEEVAELFHKFPAATLTALGLEYRFITFFLQKKLNREEMFFKLHQAICQFAKRQETWFRRMERQGIPVHWLNANQDPIQEAMKIIDSQWPQPAPTTITL